MEKNSSIYNNKRFSQRSNNYGDYERSSVIPEPAARASNLMPYLALMPYSIKNSGEGSKNAWYPDSIKNALSFKESSIYGFDSKFKEEIQKFISYMTMLNDGKDVSESDKPKVDWLRKNQAPLDQYNEFTNWSQSERQKYKERFNTMLGNPRGAILQKALIALKNAEIAAAKYSFPNDDGVKGARYMSDGAADSEANQPETKPAAKPTAKPETTPSAESLSGGSAGEQKPQKTYEKFNLSYIPFVKKIKNSNDLLFFATMQAFKIKSGEYKKENESVYYNKDNYDRIKKELYKIANSPYLNEINQLLEGLYQAALDKLKEKVDRKPDDTNKPNDKPAVTTAPPSTVNPQDRPGRSTSLTTTNTGNFPEAGKEDLFDVSTFGPEAQEFIRDTVQPIKDMAEKDLTSFKLQGQELINQSFDKFNSIKNKLYPKEIMTIETMLNNLQAKYMSAFSETGVSRAGRSFAVVDYRQAAQEALSLFDRRIYLRDPVKIQEKRDKLEKILNIYQTQFINKHPGDYYIEQYIKPINKEIAFWNARYSNMTLDKDNNIEMLDILRPAPRI